MTQDATLLRQVAALGRNLFQNRLVGGLEECAFSATVEGQVIMSRRAIFSLAASVIIGIGCVAMISTDAFAYRGGRVGVGRVGVHHGGVYRGGVYRGAAVRRGVAVGVGAAAVGAAAYGAYGAQRCGYYPYGPCY